MLKLMTMHHIAAGEKIVIGDNVTSKSFISDLNHGNYKGENLIVRSQP
jgi:hypothetical protein